MEELKHFYLGENHIFFPDEEFIIHMAEPRCFIRFNIEGAFTASYDQFFESIADVQWIDGKPLLNEINIVLTNAWNFLCIEERLLEEYDDEEDF